LVDAFLFGIGVNLGEVFRAEARGDWFSTGSGTRHQATVRLWTLVMC
jgi:hypothetical protein